MATPIKRPKRLEILPHCRILGVVEGKELRAGVYERGKNISEEAFDKLLTPEFAHAVREFVEKPVELAQIKDSPMESPGDIYRRKRREAEEQAKSERWGGGGPVQYTTD